MLPVSNKVDLFARKAACKLTRCWICWLESHPCSLVCLCCVLAAVQIGETESARGHAPISACVRPTLIFRSLRPHAANLGQINNKTRVRWRVFVNQETRDIGSVCQFGPSARLFTQQQQSSTSATAVVLKQRVALAYHADKHLALADSGVSISKYFLWWRRAH